MIEFIVFGIVESFLQFINTASVVILAGGWVVFLILLFAMIFQAYMLIIQHQFREALEWSLISIRVGEDNERGPRAMEEVFNELHGLEKKPDLLDTYIDGYVQPWYSFEIRGTAQGVSFMIRTPVSVRHMVEAAIYAQYPDAEIEEVPDYMEPYTPEQVEKEFDIWASELRLLKPDVYPLRTYIDFEDQFAEDGRLVDPMASVTEELSAGLKPGEEMWIQIVARPVITSDWQEKGMKLALKMAGRDSPPKPGAVERVFQAFADIVAGILPGPEASTKETKKENDLGALKLTPGETDIVRAIQRNVSKWGYDTLYRMAYVAPVSVFDRKGKTQAFFGLFRQFSSIDLNQYKPLGKFITSKPTYYFPERRKLHRKRRAVRRLRGRQFFEKGDILTTEELATIYHFPHQYVRTPTLERTRSRRGEAPTNVPLAPTGSFFT